MRPIGVGVKPDFEGHSRGTNGVMGASISGAEGIADCASATEDIPNPRSAPLIPEAVHAIWTD